MRMGMYMYGCNPFRVYGVNNHLKFSFSARMFNISIHMPLKTFFRTPLYFVMYQSTKGRYCKQRMQNVNNGRHTKIMPLEKCTQWKTKAFVSLRSLILSFKNMILMVGCLIKLHHSQCDTNPYNSYSNFLAMESRKDIVIVRVWGMTGTGGSELRVMWWASSDLMRTKETLLTKSAC